MRKRRAQLLPMAYLTRTTRGAPGASRIDGVVVFGQYRRKVSANGPFGAGSQLDSFFFPGLVMVECFS